MRVSQIIKIIILLLGGTIALFWISISFKSELAGEQKPLLSEGAILIIKPNSTNTHSWSWTQDTPNKALVLEGQFPDFTYSHQAYWKALSYKDIQSATSAWRNFIQDYIPSNRSYTGSGIVYSCYPDAVGSVILSMKFVREHGCALPIEIWYTIANLLRHLNELDDTHIKRLITVDNVTVKNLGDLVGADLDFETRDKKFQIKSLAVLYSSFAQVFYP